MKRFIEVVPRTQVSLLPECLDGSIGRHSGQLDAAIDPHQRCPRRLRRGQAQEGLENSSGRRYAGQSACQPLSTASPLEVVKLPEAKRGFVLLPRRWVVEPSFDWAGCCTVKQPMRANGLRGAIKIPQGQEKGAPRPLDHGAPGAKALLNATAPRPPAPCTG